MRVRVAMESAEIRFQQVYDEYQGKICRYLTRMVGENEAEDLTQEVFVKIGQALETFRGESSLSTWDLSDCYQCGPRQTSPFIE